jgi:hypothetical protein
VAIPQNLQDALNAIDAETNALAAVVQDLRNRINTGMSQADVDAVTGTLGDIANRLTGIAANPAQPVPAGPTPTARP